MGRKTPMKEIGEEGDGGDDGDDDWEWEYYYEDDEGDDDDFAADELNRLSPCVNTAPTTRATSPFPLEAGHGGSREVETSRAVAEDAPEVPLEEAEEADGLHAIPAPAEAVERLHGEPGLLDPISEVSVALAAEYLGQEARQVAASLPQSFEAKQQGRVKSRGKSSRREESSEGRQRKRKKKKRRSRVAGDEEEEDGEDEGYRPKYGVRDLVNMLEPRLFQDEQSGTKMVMTREQAAMSKRFQEDVAKEEVETGVRRATSVKQIVQRISSARMQSVREQSGAGLEFWPSRGGP